MAHCKVGKIKHEKSRRARSGRVMSTTPRAGRTLKAGTKDRALRVEGPLDGQLSVRMVRPRRSEDLDPCFAVLREVHLDDGETMLPLVLFVLPERID